jgi:hypothetical protein
MIHRNGSTQTPIAVQVFIQSLRSIKFIFEAQENGLLFIT